MFESWFVTVFTDMVCGQMLVRRILMLAMQTEGKRSVSITLSQLISQSVVHGVADQALVHATFLEACTLCGIVEVALRAIRSLSSHYFVLVFT